MQLQRSTWTLFITAILLSGVVYGVESQRHQHQTQQAQQEKLFTFTQDEIIGLTIATEAETLVFRRDRDRPTGEQWRMIKPERAIASEPIIAFLLDLLVKSESERTFPLQEREKKTYGLATPIATITIDLSGQNPTQKVLLGSPNFDGKSIYAQLNPDRPKAEIKIIPIEFQYAIDRDFDEWLAPSEDEEEED